MDLDLKSMKRIIISFIQETVDIFLIEHPFEYISGIEMHYSVESGFVRIHFDNRPKHNPGSWDESSYSNYREKDIVSWRNFYDQLSSNPSKLITNSGNELLVSSMNEGDYVWLNIEGKYNNSSQDPIAEEVGKMLVEVFFEARSQGIFANIKTYTPCEFGIEDTSGCFGWPMYEDRFRDNLLIPGSYFPPEKSSHQNNLNNITGKMPCSSCGKVILPITAQRTGGVCMPCSKKRINQAIS